MHGCTRSSADPAALRQLAEPRFVEFERFDRWARRTLDADLALRDPVALRETLFAPIQRDADISYAWVERLGPDSTNAGFRVTDAPRLPFVGLRSVPMLSGLDAARGRWRPEQTSSTRRRRDDAREADDDRVDVLVLRRTAPSGRGSGSVRVSVAFRIEPPAQ